MGSLGPSLRHSMMRCVGEGEGWWVVRIFLVREESRTEAHGWQLMPMSSVRIECPAGRLNIQLGAPASSLRP